MANHVDAHKNRNFNEKSTDDNQSDDRSPILNFPKDHNELPMVQELLAVSTDIAAILENSNEQTAIRLLESNKLTAANLKKFNDEMHEVTSISI